MLEARKLKSEDELALLDHAAAIVDAVYDEIYRTLRPGITENQVVAQAMKTLFDLGSEHVEAINAISGDRCNPHPHTFADRLLRPGDQAFFDIIHAFNGYRTCYYRTFNVGYATPSQLDAYRRCREWLDAAIDLVRPGVTTDQIADGLAGGDRDRPARRARGLRPPVRPRDRRRPLRVPDDLAAPLARGPGRARGRDGVRARDVLPGERRPLGCAHRGGGRRHADRPAGADALPGRGAARHRHARTSAESTCSNGRGRAREHRAPSRRSSAPSRIDARPSVATQHAATEHSRASTPGSTSTAGCS